MRVKNNYNQTLTNISASVQKYFGLPQKHSGLPLMDELLATHHPQNVVIILLDGLGSRILERALPESAFLRQKLKTNSHYRFSSHHRRCHQFNSYWS